MLCVLELLGCLESPVSTFSSWLGPGSRGRGTEQEHGPKGTPLGPKEGLVSQQRLWLGAAPPLGTHGNSRLGAPPGWQAMCGPSSPACPPPVTYGPQPDRSPLRPVQTVPVTAGGAPVSDRPFTRTGLLGFIGPVSTPPPGPGPWQLTTRGEVAASIR